LRSGQRCGRLLGSGTSATILAETLRTLHTTTTLLAVDAAGVVLPRAVQWVQARTDRLRRDVLPRFDRSRAGWVDERLC
jgi:hypothetical protein